MITTLVIPHYNDAERLGPFLTDLCTGLPWHFEVLVSDDGSLESEREAMRRVVREAQARVAGGGSVIREAVFTEKNTGKGGGCASRVGCGAGCRCAGVCGRGRSCGRG